MNIGLRKKYYDETDDEYVEGEWLEGEPREYRGDDVFRSGRGGRAGIKKHYRIVFDPLKGFSSSGPRGGGSGGFSGGGKKGFHFSETEKKHLLFATIILVAAFMIFLNEGLYGGLENLTSNSVFLLSGSLVAVLTGFLTHEMAHKYMALRLGYWAEFRYSKSGLLFALFLSLFGILIAAPGAVMIRGRLTKRENGLTSVAGPAVNTVWATLFLGVEFLIGQSGGLPSGLYWAVLNRVIFYGFIINTIFAGFNLLPIRFLGLDGYKVADWNIGVYFFFVGIISFYLFIRPFLGRNIALVFAVICIGVALYRKMS